MNLERYINNDISPEILEIYGKIVGENRSSQKIINRIVFSNKGIYEKNILNNENYKSFIRIYNENCLMLARGNDKIEINQTLPLASNLENSCYCYTVILLFYSFNLFGAVNILLNAKIDEFSRYCLPNKSKDFDIKKFKKINNMMENITKPEKTDSVYKNIRTMIEGSVKVDMDDPTIFINEFEKSIPKWIFEGIFIGDFQIKTGYIDIENCFNHGDRGWWSTFNNDVIEEFTLKLEDFSKTYRGLYDMNIKKGPFSDLLIKKESEKYDAKRGGDRYFSEGEIETNLYARFEILNLISELNKFKHREIWFLFRFFEPESKYILFKPLFFYVSMPIDKPQINKSLKIENILELHRFGSKYQIHASICFLNKHYTIFFFLDKDIYFYDDIGPKKHKFNFSTIYEDERVSLFFMEPKVIIYRRVINR